MNQNVGNEVGDCAPDFVLTDGTEEEWRLSEQKGQIVVLLFYPGDNTPVCTRQLCSVRDNWADYQATGATIIGISTDSTESHAKFATKNNLPLRLLSDKLGEVTRLFGVKSWLPNRAARAVIVVDQNGVIRYRKIQNLSITRPKNNEILAAIKAI